MNGVLFFVGLLASFAGGTLAVAGSRRKLQVRTVFGSHTALGGIMIEILGILMIALAQT